MQRRTAAAHTQRDTADANRSAEYKTGGRVGENSGEEVNYYFCFYFHSATCCEGVETETRLNVGGMMKCSATPNSLGFIHSFFRPLVVSLPASRVKSILRSCKMYNM